MPNQQNQGNSVELHITNLDQNMDPMELRRCLSKAFGELTQVCKRILVERDCPILVIQLSISIYRFYIYQSSRNRTVTMQR